MRACSTNGEKRNSYRALVSKPEGKRPLGRPGRSLEDNNNMGLRKHGAVWTGFIWLRIGTRGLLF
jgi:hypothetical protein